MSDDELLDELERERGFAARLGYLIFAQPMEKAAARIREQRDLLDECEQVLHSAAVYRENADFTLINATLAKLRAAQEKDR